VVLPSFCMVAAMKIFFGLAISLPSGKKYKDEITRYGLRCEEC